MYNHNSTFLYSKDKDAISILDDSSFPLKNNSIDTASNFTVVYLPSASAWEG